MQKVNDRAVTLPNRDRRIARRLAQAMLPFGLIAPACAEPDTQLASPSANVSGATVDGELRNHHGDGDHHSGQSGDGQASGGDQPGGQPTEQQAQTQTIPINLRIPAGRSIEDFAVISDDDTQIDENAHLGVLGEAGDSVVSYAAVRVKDGAHVYGDVYAIDGVRLDPDSYFEGNVTTPGVIVQDTSAHFDGQQLRTEFEVQNLDYSFEAPLPTGEAAVATDQDLGNLPPGGYKGLQLTGSSQVTLTSGVYFFDTLAVGPDANLYIDASAGPVRIVTNTVNDASGMINFTAGPSDLLLVVLGDAELTFSNYFIGTIVAPKAKVNVANQFEGAICAFKVYVNSKAHVTGGPFAWSTPSAPAQPNGPTSSNGGSNSQPGPITLPPISTPEQLPAPTPIDLGNCSPELEVQDEDTAPRLSAVAAQAGCDPVRYCRLVVGADGRETYEEVPSTPLYSDDLPVPAAAVQNGCSEEPGTSTCPTLADGEQAASCEPMPADSGCLTVTLCPGSDATDDPNAPSYEASFTPQVIDKARELLPDGEHEISSGEVVGFRSKNSLYIDPCEWEEAVHSFDMGFDVTGNKKGEGAECETNDDCNSGECSKGEADFFGACTKAESKIRFDLGEGNGVVHVEAGAGIPEARSRVQRAAFFPSTSFDVKSTMLAYANAVIFGQKLPLLNAQIHSEITECRHSLTWSADAFSLDSPIVARLGPTLDPLTVSAFADGELDTGDDITPASEEAQCEAAKADLWDKERRANEALHDALIAATFWNTAGGTGEVIHSREDAQAFVDAYHGAIDAYNTALQEFLRQQDGAIIRERAVMVANHERGVEVGYSFIVPVGPVPVSVELGATGTWGLRDMRVENSVKTQYSAADGLPCDGVECMRVRTESSGTPWSSLTAYAFGGFGKEFKFHGLKIGAKVGVVADLDLVKYETPLTSSFALERVTWNQDDADQAVGGNIPQQLRGLLGTDPAVLGESQFRVTPQIAQFQAPYALGGGLDSPDEVLTHASFLDGKIKLSARVSLLLGSIKFEKTLISWKGIEHAWKVADGNSGDALRGMIGMPVPNMVLMPIITVNDTGGDAEPYTASGQIAGTYEGRETGSYSHYEDRLGMPWDENGDRCAAATVIR